MKHFPIFLDTQGIDIVVSGGGGAAISKLRLLLKSQARLSVFSADPDEMILAWVRENRLRLHNRKLVAGDVQGAALFYAADEDPKEDARTAAIGQAEGALVNIVDNLGDSAFITPAIVDRDPVTVAIGTEGAAPVLARKIKADLEEALPPSLGALARIGKAFRKLADTLPMGRARRDFWSDYYLSSGPWAYESGGVAAAEQALERLLDSHLGTSPKQGHVDFVGAGPGDPELLTLKARRALDRADVVIHDRLVTPEVLELARREALLVDAGKSGFGAAMPQSTINALIVEHAQSGAHVVRLKGGDPTVFGRLDEEIDALAPYHLSYSIIPGITSASAAVASIGQSFTKRGRNSSVRFLTGHDMKGFADQDWAALAREGEVAAIYMGKRAARFIQGRILMHAASPNMPVTVVVNASRPDGKTLSTTLGQLEPTLSGADLDGPALTILGLAPREAENKHPVTAKEAL